LMDSDLAWVNDKSAR